MGSLVKRRLATGLSLLNRLSTGALRSSRNCADGARMMMMSTAVNSPPSSSRLMSPWLMLPPVFEGGGDMVFKFYNPSEDKEEIFRSSFKSSEEQIADADTKFVGSSHGWLALFNQRTNKKNHLFLYNPITRRHINLPPIETLPDPRTYLTPDGRATVSKLVLSSSPDDDECIAMMTFGQGDRLAFCLPCRSSTQWTPIGDLFFKGCPNPFLYYGMSYGRAYEDFIYCDTLKRFICTTQFKIDLLHFYLCDPGCQLEGWDLSDPHSPISTTCNVGDRFLKHANGDWMDLNFGVLDVCRQIPYLVFSEQDNQQLFIVIRFVMDRVGPDGSFVEVEDIPYDPVSGRSLVDTYPYKTVGFGVLKFDIDDLKNREGVVSLVKGGGGGSLDGLAMFVGMNHSFAVSADEFPNLKPNSIYFTDANRHADSICGGHDIGIFDYENKTLSSCYCYPCDDAPSLTRIAPPPMWFTPSLYS